MDHENDMLRLRRTFVDFGPAAPLPTTRSQSYPPSRASHNPNDPKRIDLWTERADRLLAQNVNDDGAAILYPSAETSMNSSDPALPEENLASENVGDVFGMDFGKGSGGKGKNRFDEYGGGDVEISESEGERAARRLSQTDAHSVASRPSCADLSQSPLGSSDENPVAVGVAWADATIPLRRPSSTSASSAQAVVTLQRPSTSLASSSSQAVPPPGSASGETTAASAEVTTLKMSYIPSRMPKESVIDGIHQMGFANAYDLIYIPVTARSQRQKNLRYVFVNFKTPGLAESFSSTLLDCGFPGRSLEKRCATNPALCQGFEANIQMHTSSNAPGWLGVVDDDGLLTWNGM